MTPPWLLPAFVLVLGYLLGSIPFGLLLTRFTGAGDLRQIGSGNIGATNVLRTGRKGLAAVTLLLDLLKGAAAVLIGAALVDGGGPMAGAMAFIGHCYPVWLRFAGGKGVATMMGVVTAMYWPAGIVFAVVWLGALFGPNGRPSAACPPRSARRSPCMSLAGSIWCRSAWRSR